MKKYLALIPVALLFFSLSTEAQFWGGGIYVERGYRRPPPSPPPPPPYSRRNFQQVPHLPEFKPTLNLSIGYSYPNLDKDKLAMFFDVYKGSGTQQGPVTGAIDYQFSRFSSIGLLGTYGKASILYYDYNSSGNLPAFYGYIENWSVMLNMMNYLPTYNKYISPYLRTAIGINNWKQDYLYDNGEKAAILEDPSRLAYQISIGSKFNFSRNAGFYIEAGYGKYIVNGGLAFQF